MVNKTIHLIYEPTAQWVRQAYWFTNWRSVLLQNLLHAQMLNTLGFTLLLWLLCRLVLPETNVLWYEKPVENLLFVLGLLGSAYAMQFAKGLLTPLFMDQPIGKEVVTIIEIGERVIDQADVIVDLPWEDLQELKIGPMVTLFSFLKVGQEPVYITVPSAKISVSDRNLMRRLAPVPQPTFGKVYRQLLATYKTIPRQLLRQGLFIFGVILFIEWALV